MFDENEYRLAAPIDFDEYCELINNNDANDQHHKEFYLRMIMHFIESVYSEQKPKDFVLYALADAFTKIINGGRWEDELPLPWDDAYSPWTRAESKDLQVFCMVSNMLKSGQESDVTEAIKKAASDSAVSYEKARAGYYKFKKIITN